MLTHGPHLCENVLGEYDERVDIWAYGMMLIEMINRDQPFPCVSSEEVQQLVLAKKLPQVLFVLWFGLCVVIVIFSTAKYASTDSRLGAQGGA